MNMLQRWRCTLNKRSVAYMDRVQDGEWLAFDDLTRIVTELSDISRTNTSLKKRARIYERLINELKARVEHKELS